jgi:anti-sigma B factor antagonist
MDPALELLDVAQKDWGEKRMIAKLETEGGCKILRVSGRIDFESALDFEQQINSMIQQEDDCFIIELAEVELLSSAGLRVLLSTAKRVSHRDASLGLAAPSQVVSQVFEISHFNLLFKIFPSVAEAIATLKGPSHAAKPASPQVSTGTSANAQKALASTSESHPESGADSQVSQDRSGGEATPPVSAPAPFSSVSQSRPSKADPIAPAGKQERLSAKPPSEPTSPSPMQASEPSSSGRQASVPPQLSIAEAAPSIVSGLPPVLPSVPAPRVSPLQGAAETVLPSEQPPPFSQIRVTPPRAAETIPPVARPSKTPPPPLEVAKSKPSQSPPFERRASEPPPLPGAETAVPIARPPQSPSVARPSGPPPRVEASYPAQLEIRAEGNSYPCKDGDVIGGAGHLGKAYFAQIPGLAPRHLLIGKLDGRWFIFTPQTVQHPFLFDGHSLVAGERKFLQYAEHQMEFNGHVFGLRLKPEPRKQGFFGRIFGKK